MRNRCDICGLPFTRSYHRLKDNRCICLECMKSAVKSLPKAQAALHKVLQYLKDHFHIIIRRDIHLQLVDTHTLEAVRRNFSGHGSQDTRALGLFLRKGDIFQVYLKSYLPYSLCLGVLAHEYTHAWQADHFPSNASILWIEGLAEWIAYHTLLHYGYTKQAQQILKQRDEYGQGLRKVLAFEKKYGHAQTIPSILKTLS